MTLFKKKPPKAPAKITGKIATIYQDMINRPHLLIAGATGSGKSVVINELIRVILYSSPLPRLILIDPKRVELIEYKPLPNTLRYASEPEQITAALNYAVDIMEYRYKIMQRARQKKTDAPPIYIIVDEFADLMTVQKRETLPALCRLAQLGRAAGMHLIIATQRPTRDIINGQIKVNIDARLALRCPTAQDSRNIINITGAEKLPRYGSGIYLTPDLITPTRYALPMSPPDEFTKIIEFTKKYKR